MNRDQALNVCTAMAAAWPYPEWDKGRVELWVAVLLEEDAEAAEAAVVQAVRECDRAPSVAWMLEAIASNDRSEERFGLPESSEVPASKDTALAAIRAAREVLPGSPTPESEADHG